MNALSGLFHNLACATVRNGHENDDTISDLLPPELLTITDGGTASNTPNSSPRSTPVPPTPSPQTLTKAALAQYKGTALELSAAANLHASPRSQQEDRELIGLLAAQMRRAPKVEGCQMMIRTYELLARQPRNRAALLSQSLPQLLACVQRHLDHEGLQESALGLLGNLACGHAEHQLALLRAGCVQHAVLCLQQHVESAAVHRNAYRFLRNVTSHLAGGNGGGEEEGSGGEGAAESDGDSVLTATITPVDQQLTRESIEILLTHRVPPLVSFMLHRHIESQEVIAHALAALWSFACSPPLAKILCESAAADGVLRAMNRHVASAEVQRCGLGALMQILDAAASSNTSGRSTPQPPPSPLRAAPSPQRAALPSSPHRPRPMPGPAELAPPVLSAAYAHLSVVDVQVGAMEVLASLARSRRAPPLQQSQLLDALRVGAAALATNSPPHRLTSDINVVQSVLMLLEAALPDPESACAPLVHSEVEGMLPELLKSVDEHSEDIELAEAAVTLLSKLSNASKTLAPSLIKAGGLHTALRLLQRHLNEPSVAIDAVDFLRCLLSFAPAEAVAAFTNADGLRWTLRMMGAHRQRLDVQEACCSILWSCALDPATSSTHPLLQPSNEDLQAALLPLEQLQQQESPRLARVHRAACGLLWTLSHRPTHARALCAPCWVSLIASCSVSRVDDSRVLEYMCGIASNILAAGAGAGTTPGQLSPVAAVRRFAEGSVVINDDGVRCEDVM